MITGQFTGQLFAKEVYNQNFPDQDLLFKNKTAGGSALNSLFLNDLYVLYSASSASYSELLINGLYYYFNLKQIGDFNYVYFLISYFFFIYPNFYTDFI